MRGGRRISACLDCDEVDKDADCAEESDSCVRWRRVRYDDVGRPKHRPSSFDLARKVGWGV